jgi:hypothetical protein
MDHWNRVKIFALVLIAGAVHVACQKKSDSPSAEQAPAQVATPQPCNVPNTPGCNPQNQVPNTPYNYQYNGNYYNGYYYGGQFYGIPQPQSNNWLYGQWYWPTQWNPNIGTCGCQSGYYPTYNPGTGLACAPFNYLNLGVTVWYNWGLHGPAQNSPFSATPQQYYQGPVNTQCSSGIAQGCDTRTNNCPAGSSCQAAGGGSVFGLCVKNP